MGFEVFCRDLCSWEALKFRLVHVDIILSCFHVTHKISGIGNAEEICRHEIHIDSLEELKCFHRILFLGCDIQERKKSIEEQHMGQRLQILGILQVGLGVHVGYHPLLHRMRLMLLHADQVKSSKIRKLLDIPWILFIAAHIYLAEAIEGCNTELVWGKPHGGAVLLVGSKDGAGFEARSTLPPHPCGEKRGAEVGAGDFGKRRDEGREKDIMVNCEKEQDQCTDG